MAGDKDLNDDLIKRVRYWAVYTEQGLEATFPDAFCTITGRKDENRFISWKTSEFYNKISATPPTLDMPEEWHAMRPEGVDVAGGKITAIKNPANEFLLIDFEVVSRYQKEDLQMDVRQAKFYETGSLYFNKELKNSKIAGGGPGGGGPGGGGSGGGGTTAPSGSPSAHGKAMLQNQTST